MKRKTWIKIVVIAILLSTITVLLVPQVTWIDIDCEAVKVDTIGNIMGTFNIQIQGCMLDYLVLKDRMDLSISDLDNLSGIQLNGTSVRFGNIDGMIKSYDTREYFAVSLHGWHSPSNALFFGAIGFSPELDRWAICNYTGGEPAYYIFDTNDLYTTQELIDYFNGIHRIQLPEKKNVYLN